MSGGSFDYLYCKSLGDFSLDDLNRMIGRLEMEADESGNERFMDAAAHLRTLRSEIYRLQREAETTLAKYSELMRRVEWYYSGDSNADTVANAVAEMDTTE